MSHVIIIHILYYLPNIRKGGNKTVDDEDEVVKPVLYASRLGARYNLFYLKIILKQTINEVHLQLCVKNEEIRILPINFSKLFCFYAILSKLKLKFEANFLFKVENNSMNCLCTSRV